MEDVSFAKRFGDRLVTVEQDGYSLSWSVQAVPENTNSMSATSQPLTGSAQAELTATDLSAYSAQQQMTMATKSSSAIAYRDALAQDVDLEYIVLPSRVKENIILQSPKDISAYVVTVYTEGLAARLLENRQIQFYDGEDVIFTMSSPYMYDSGAELSEDIAVELVPKGSGCWLIRMVPDEAWLEDEARVYPVVIDPEVSTGTTQQNIIDTYVLEGAGVQNDDLDRLYIGNRSGGRNRAYVRFVVMPMIPSTAVITAATMTLQLLSGTSTANNISAYQVLAAWDPSTVTWSTRPSASTRIGLNFGHNNLSHYDISCLATVQSWYSDSTTGQNANYGIMLRYTDETIADYNSVYSADYVNENKRPALTINYLTISLKVTKESGYLFVGETQIATCTTTPSGLEVNWSSSDSDIATVSNSGVITGKSEGNAKISATYYHASSGSVCSAYVNVNVFSTYGLEDGISYYIMNYETKRLLSLEAFSDIDSTNVYTRERIRSSSSRWRLEERSDKRFQLVNAYSSTSKVLHVTGSNVDLYTNNNSENTKFTIYRLNSGVYAGLYYIRYGSYFVAQDVNNNVYLTSSPSNKAIWSFSPVTAGYADIFSHDYYYSNSAGSQIHFDTSVNNQHFKTVMSTILGYTANSFTNGTASNAYNTLRSDNQQVFVFRGHGGPGIIGFYTEGNTATGGIYADSVVADRYTDRDDQRFLSLLSENALCSLRCVLYLGCNTGGNISIDGSTYNTVDATYEKGAHFVLGTTETIYNGQGNRWLEYFLDYVEMGCSIEEACQNANDDLGYITVPVDEKTNKTVYGLPTYSVGDNIQYLQLP